MSPLHDLLTYLVIVFPCLGFPFIVYQVLSHLVSPIAFKELPSWSTPSKTRLPFEGWIPLSALM